MDFREPCVMGILNATPDSFFAASRMQLEKDVVRRALQILEEGGKIIDVGAVSTRPGAEYPDCATEMNRLRLALTAIRKVLPDAVLSVDTFRADVAWMCADEFGVAIINDVAGGADEAMFPTMARLGLPYVLTCGVGASPAGSIVRETLLWLSQQLLKLREMGVKDIIVDPGFGFGKTLEENYEVLHHLSDFALLNAPLLVGISRKSMIWRLLETTPEHALNGTTALHALCLHNGADILRVHDVKAAVEVVKLCSYTNHISDHKKQNNA